MAKFLALVLALGVFLGVQMHVRASTVIALDLNEIVKRADVVAYVEVVSRSGAVDKGRPVTYCTMRVLEPVKGNANRGDALTFVFWGGVDPKTNIGMTVVGEPGCPEAGSKLVAAGYRTDSGLLRVVGLAQGYFEVKKDVHGKDVVVSNGTHMERVKRDSKTGRLTYVSAAVTEPEAVGTFLDRLRSIAAKTNAGSR